MNMGQNNGYRTESATVTNAQITEVNDARTSKSQGSMSHQSPSPLAPSPLSESTTGPFRVVSRAAPAGTSRKQSNISSIKMSSSRSLKTSRSKQGPKSTASSAVDQESFIHREETHSVLISVVDVQTNANTINARQGPVPENRKNASFKNNSSGKKGIAQRATKMASDIKERAFMCTNPKTDAEGGNQKGAQCDMSDDSKENMVGRDVVVNRHRRTRNQSLGSMPQMSPADASTATKGIFSKGNQNTGAPMGHSVSSPGSDDGISLAGTSVSSITEGSSTHFSMRIPPPAAAAGLLGALLGDTAMQVLEKAQTFFGSCECSGAREFGTMPSGHNPMQQGQKSYTCAAAQPMSSGQPLAATPLQHDRRGVC